MSDNIVLITSAPNGRRYEGIYKASVHLCGIQASETKTTKQSYRMFTVQAHEEHVGMVMSLRDLLK